MPSSDDTMATEATPGHVASTDGLGVSSSGAPRVEACIEAVMAKHPTIGGRADMRYFEAVHQELAPLARELERLADSEGTRAVELLRRARQAETEARTLRLRYGVVSGWIVQALKVLDTLDPEDSPEADELRKLIAAGEVLALTTLANSKTPNVRGERQ